MGAKAFHRIASRRTLALSAPAQPHNSKQAIIILWTIFLSALAKVYLSPFSISHQQMHFPIFFSPARSHSISFIFQPPLNKHSRKFITNRPSGRESPNNEKCLLIKRASSSFARHHGNHRTKRALMNEFIESFSVASKKIEINEFYRN
jgi:hypothetical protein